MQKLEFNIREDSIFKILNKDGLITFSDYIFLVTLLSSKNQNFLNFKRNLFSDFLFF